MFRFEKIGKARSSSPRCDAKEAAFEQGGCGSALGFSNHSPQIAARFCPWTSIKRSI